MGAGRQRWWRVRPFAEVHPSESQRGWHVLRIGGVYVDNGYAEQMTNVLQKIADRINAALDQRVLRLEADVQRLGLRAIEQDQALQAGQVLGALSDDALLDEFERRGAHLEVELYERRNEREGRGRTMDAFRRQEYLGEWMTVGTPAREPRWARTYEQRTGRRFSPALWGDDRADAMALTFQGPPVMRPPRPFAGLTFDDVMIDEPPPIPAAPAPLERCARKGCTATPTRGSHCAIHQPGRPRRRGR